MSELGIISDGGILIRDGRIDQVGTSRRMENLIQARNAVEINAAGRVVMPGFVDSHTHLMFPPPGIDRDDDPEEAGRRAILGLPTQRLLLRGRSCLRAMARHGTTMVEAKTGCGPFEDAESKLLRVLGMLHQSPLDVIPSFLFRLPRAGTAAEDEAAADWLAFSFLPKLRQRNLARFVDLHIDSNPSRLGLFRQCLAAAREHGFPRRIHADDSSPFEAVSLALEYGVTSIDLAEELSADHIVRLARSGTIVTLLPYTCFRAGRYPNVRTLIDAGAAVALASDFNPILSPSLNMQSALSIACSRMRMSPAEAISAATVNGAYAIGCAGAAGELSPGAMADVLFINASDYREIPGQLGSNLVHLTLKCGCPVYQESEV